MFATIDLVLLFACGYCNWKVSSFMVAPANRWIRHCCSSKSSNDSFLDDDDYHDDLLQERISEIKQLDNPMDDVSDWVQAELTLRNSPNHPSPDLEAEQVALIVCRSLQWVDLPHESAGLERCYEFFTFECRKLVTARQGGESVERFRQYGVLSPALQPFMGASRIKLGQGTYTPAKPPLRGALMSFPVTIISANIMSLMHPSGMTRAGIASVPPSSDMVIRLEQQRRPPNQGCWLVREILDVRHAFAGDMGNAHVGG